MFRSLCIAFVALLGLGTLVQAGDCYSSYYQAPTYAVTYGSYPGYSYSWTYTPEEIHGNRLWPAGYYTKINGLYYRYGYGVEHGALITAPVTIAPVQFVQPALAPPPQPAMQYAAPASQPGFTAEEITKLKLLLSQLQVQPTTK